MAFLVPLVIILILSAFLIVLQILVKMRIKQMDVEFSNQTSDIWNISGRVNQQDGAVTSEPRWPTHDHHLSIDSFGLAENLQSQKKDRVPPPPYCEVDLPTYEEAIAVREPKMELPSIHITPSSSSHSESSLHS